MIQIPGPPEEVRCVQEIYRLFLEEQMSFLAIAQELNRRRIPYLRGSDWDNKSVKAILTHPKYAGINQYGRFSTRLYTPRIENPRSEWAVSPGAFEPVVEPKVFEKVQEILATFTRNRSNETVLETLRDAFAKEGRLSMDLIERTPGLPSATTIRTRFGSISHAYELVGYERNDGYTRKGRLAEIRSIRRMRQELMHEIVALSEGRAKIEDRGAKFRTRIRLRGGRRVAVVVSRWFCDYKDNDRWRLKCVSGDHRLVAVVARLNRPSDGFMDCFVVPPIRTSKMVRLLKDDPRLNRAIRLDDRRDFIRAVITISTKKQPSMVWSLNEKSVAIATNDQLRRLAMFSTREFISRGMNQRTLGKIYALRPVRPSKLANCLKILQQCEAERNGVSKVRVAC